MFENLLPDEGAGVNNDMTISEMRRELLVHYNFSGANKLPVEEVEEAWLGYELQRQFEAMADNVRFPMYPASALKEEDNWEVLLEFDFAEGATFLKNKALKDDFIPDLLDLLAAFVHFDTSGKKHTNWQKDGAVYTAIPQMFIDFAKQCRLDVCYRLLRRCLRHAFDGRTKALDVSNRKTRLIRHRGQIGIQISAPIAASMKKDIYEGETVFTKHEILCACCDCKSGAQGEERNACVHTMPRGMLLSILLAEDLAEHILLELTSMLTSIAVESDVWDMGQIEKMKKSVIVLMEASGELLVAREAAEKTNLFEMLQHYKTGTQLEKKWNRVNQRPKQNEIGPFESVLLDSPEQQAKELFNQTAAKPNLDPNEGVVALYNPDYILMGFVLQLIGFDLSKSDAIGYKLLERRRNKQCSDQNTFISQIFPLIFEWKDLLTEAETRSMRQSKQQRANLNPKVCRQDSCDLTSQDFLTPPPKKKKKSGGEKKCAKEGCDNYIGMEGIEFNRVPDYPPDLPDNASLNRKLTHAAKKEFRREFSDRLGRGRGDTTKGLRVCNGHPLQTIRRRVWVEDSNGTKMSKAYELTLKNHGLERQMTGHIIQTLVIWMSRRNFKKQIKLMERLLSSAIFWIEDTEVMMQHI